VRHLSQRDNALALLEEYPVLARQLVQAVDRWLAVTLEFLEHLSTDWKMICAIFNANNDPGTLEELHGSAARDPSSGSLLQFRPYLTYSNPWLVLRLPHPNTPANGTKAVKIPRRRPSRRWGRGQREGR
jgi:hypothetical protein